MTARRALFQLHWFLGITAGFVLALMGVTGAAMAFEDEIMAALSPGVVTLALPVGAAAGEASDRRLSPDALVAAASYQRDGARVQDVTIERDPARAAAVHFMPEKGQRRGDRSYIDPRTGVLLGKATGAGVFRTIQDLHRWLALPGAGNGIGRQITGFSAIALIFFALSGLYLRWPRHPLDWRAWLVLDLRKTGRNLYRALHAVIGGWMLAFYLLSALTGLWWSYGWYREGVRYALTGQSAPAERSKADTPTGPSLPIAPAWASFLRSEGARYERVVVTLSTGDKPVTMRVLPQGARFDRMTDELRFDAVTGALVKTDRYADRSTGETIATNVYPIHTGAFFGLPGRIALFLTSLTMPLFTVTGLLLYLARRRNKRALAAVTPSGQTEDGTGVLVVHASQTGTAERLARLSAAAFPQATVRAMAAVSPADMRAAGTVLFVVATYGEGDPPDPARAFERSVMATPADLSDVDYAVLALGDREYADFCSFGHRVDAWLHAGGARRLFDLIELDGDDTDGERHWQQQLHAIGADTEQPDWQPAAYAPGPLVERTLVNPGSPGAPVYRVVLAAPADTDWAPGAIAEIQPRHDPARIDRALAACDATDDAALRDALATAILPEDGTVDPTALKPLPHRDYSVASIAASGVVELLVRQCPAADGGLGIGSGWLTKIAAIGDPIPVRIRANPGFAAPEDPATPLVLIGNGTGLAGLMAHLRDRAQTGGGPAWLLYGERSAGHDRPFADELGVLLGRGTLARIDRAFSRDAGCGRYVQHLLFENASGIVEWADRGAAFYVCGSLAGMASAVDAALRAILGDDRVETMIATSSYRRDIY
ncbi:PepSY domain-containing protein [Sphingomonas faeni]|uniref:PepSY domain-containing protein n=1 Tax=Sphingomonas faeni TaxID=185950 RepID=UPI0020C82EED|nr:sulfite reductase flavoprotein subunit alpha [Sphingomonas faeni]MCP8891520.1 sulfite reductase flavoprotein subunit alpha [Sphingomonas faeni]